MTASAQRRQSVSDRAITALTLTVVLALLTGCGSARSDLAEVTGKITLDGQPLEEALVEFVPQGGQGVVSMGRTDASGNYYQMATRSARGASLGENKVRISTFEILDQGGKQVPVKERVPTKYNSATELSVTVKAGRNQFNFDLESAGGKVMQQSARNLQ